MKATMATSTRALHVWCFRNKYVMISVCVCVCVSFFKAVAHIATHGSQKHYPS